MCPLIGLDIWLSVPHFSQSTYQSTIKKRKEKKKKKKPVSVCGLFVFSEVWSLKRSRLCVQCEYWMHDCLLKAALLLWGFLNVHWIVFWVFLLIKIHHPFQKVSRDKKKTLIPFKGVVCVVLQLKIIRRGLQKGKSVGSPPPSNYQEVWGRHKHKWFDGVEALLRLDANF